MMMKMLGKPILSSVTVVANFTLGTTAGPTGLADLWLSFNRFTTSYARTNKNHSSKHPLHHILALSREGYYDVLVCSV